MFKVIALLKVNRRLVLTTGVELAAQPSIMQLLAFPQHDSVRDVMLPLLTAAVSGKAYVPLQIDAETTFEVLFRYFVSALISL
jgi:hypothetical protein